ncbi:MAG: hypothetical protein ACKOPS_19985, partial [Cyanobium sp.]
LVVCTATASLPALLLSQPSPRERPRPPQAPALELAEQGLQVTPGDLGIRHHPQAAAWPPPGRRLQKRAEFTAAHGLVPEP